MNNVIVVAPHADDEVLGCGGTIFNHSEKGDNVYVIIATDASVGAPELFTNHDIETVRSEALAAHKVLGVKSTIFMDFPAPALNAFPEYKISTKLSEIFYEINPRFLYLPHPGDLHQDHNAVYRAALVAARPNENRLIKNIFCYETLSETEWAPHQGSNRFSPNHFVDISGSIEIKIAAMKCFRSQLKNSPHPRSEAGIISLSSYRGNTVCISKCEAFEVERQILSDKN